MSGGWDGRIFVSYRRDDTAHLVGRLVDRLTGRFGEGRVFLDVDSIPAGAAFAEVIETEIRSCTVLLAVIGRRWLDMSDVRGGRRLDDPDDLVVREIATAFANGVRVIPVLADGATLPPVHALPSLIARLAGLNAVTMGHLSFRSDFRHLARQLSAIAVREVQTPRVMEGERWLGGRYALGATIGYSTISRVLLARDMHLGHDVVVKVLRSELAHDPTFVMRFLRAVRVAAVVRHPSIAAFYDLGQDGANTYVVMERAEGRSLRDLLRDEGAVPVHRTLDIMVQVCDALDFAHRQAVLHRDLKPAHVVVSDDGDVRVLDFTTPRIMVTGATITPIIGETGYMAPEVVRGDAVDARSDVYSAGCLLFELLTGRPPFMGDSLVAVAHRHLWDPPPLPSDHDADLPTSLDVVVRKAMAKHPAERYQSAAEMRTVLTIAMPEHR